VIDLKENLNTLLKMDIRSFLKTHLQNDLNMTFSKNNERVTFDEWLTSKQVILSLNKKDLIDASQIERLSQLLAEKQPQCDIKINQISSINDDQERNDIKDLLGHLKLTLEKM
jgi:GTPase involved in cell partitioning and DNA repair